MDRDKLARPSNAPKNREIVPDSIVRGDPLPRWDDPETGLSLWHERTEAWYENMRRSEVAQTWVQADWDYLVDTAMLHSQMWHGDAKLAAELRQRMMAFGITPQARQSLRLTIKSPADKAAESAKRNGVASGAVVDMTDRRAAVGDG